MDNKDTPSGEKMLEYLKGIFQNSSEQLDGSPIQDIEDAYKEVTKFEKNKAYTWLDEDPELNLKVVCIDNYDEYGFATFIIPTKIPEMGKVMLEFANPLEEIILKGDSIKLKDAIGAFNLIPKEPLNQEFMKLKKIYDTAKY